MFILWLQIPPGESAEFIVIVHDSFNNNSYTVRHNVTREVNLNPVSVDMVLLGDELHVDPAKIVRFYARTKVAKCYNGTEVSNTQFSIDYCKIICIWVSIFLTLFLRRILALYGIFGFPFYYRNVLSLKGDETFAPNHIVFLLEYLYKFRKVIGHEFVCQGYRLCLLLRYCLFLRF